MLWPVSNWELEVSLVHVDEAGTLDLLLHVINDTNIISGLEGGPLEHLALSRQVGVFR